MHTQSPTSTEAVPAARVATEPTTVAPVQRLGQRLMEGARARFRLHTEEHEAPGNARVLAMAGVSALCVFAGLIPAGRLLAAMAIGHGPWWYPMATISLGLIGVGLITAAFAAIHRAYLPWYLLSGAAMMLAANVAMVYLIF